MVLTMPPPVFSFMAQDLRSKKVVEKRAKEPTSKAVEKTKRVREEEVEEDEAPLRAKKRLIVSDFPPHLRR